MRNLLFLCLLAVSLQVAGQVSPLPVDSVSGKVTYQGVVQVPGATRKELFLLARNYAATSATPAVIDTVAKSITGTWERRIVFGDAWQKIPRIVVYEMTLTVKDGRYRYVLTNFLSKSVPLQHQEPIAGITVITPSAQAPIERVLSNPTSYKKGKPTIAFVSFCTGVDSEARKSVADLQTRMKPSKPAKDW